MINISEVINAMISYYSGDTRRINHFLKVYALAKTIGEMEQLDIRTQQILEVAAVTHDIGIKNSEIKYNSTAGCYQQTEGPPEAKELLEELYFDSDLIDRVCWLIAHHHTYDDITDIDCEILVEADFLVNVFEDELSVEAINNIKQMIFRTVSGRKLLDEMYNLI
ncbi:MAG: HD domain-containing protein [Eubacteriales bacterium]